MIGGRRGGGGGAFGMGSMLLLLLGVTWFVSPSVAGIQCYICRGEEEECPGPYGKEVTCSREGVEGCYLIIYERKDGTGKPNVIRECAKKSEATKDAYCEKDKDEGKKQKMSACYCKTDLCNGDPSSLGLGSNTGSGGGNSNDTFKKYPSSVIIFVAAAVAIVIKGR